MKRLSFLTCLTILILCFSLQALNAQKLKRSKARRPSVTEGYVDFGASLGGANYFGDLPTDIALTRPSAGIFLARKLGPRTHARLSFTWAQILADDASAPPSEGVYARNLHFRNNIKELGLGLVFDLIPSYGKHFRRSGFTPFVSFGIALLHHNPQAKLPTELAQEYGDEWVELQPLGTEGQGRPGYDAPYNKIQWAIPLGIGFKFKINERWSFGVESSFRYTFNDYLDDVSGEYPEMATLGNPLAVAFSNRTLESTAAFSGTTRDLNPLIERFGVENYVGFDGQVYRTLGSFKRGESARGSRRYNDFYLITGFHLSYIINVGLKCPQSRW